MKVSNQEIINAVWNKQLHSMCSSFVTRYCGGSYGLSPMETCERFDIEIGSTQRSALNVNLSNGQLLHRIRALIKGNKLHSGYRNLSGSFYYGVIRNDEFNWAILDIRRYWSSLGLGNRHETVALDNFDELLSKLRVDILMKYGKPKN